MAGRHRAVLLVDQAYGVTGVRRTASGRSMPGGVFVVDSTCGPESIPADLVPTEIHVAITRDFVGVLQAEMLEECSEYLMELAGMIEHAHFAVDHIAPMPGGLLVQTCRCGARRQRPRGRRDWSEWA